MVKMKNLPTLKLTNTLCSVSKLCPKYLIKEGACQEAEQPDCSSGAFSSSNPTTRRDLSEFTLFVLRFS